MTRENFNYLCEICGDQSRVKTDRWRDIKSIQLEQQMEAMGDFQRKLKESLITYIDILSGDDYLTGFLYFSYVAPSVDFTNKNGPYITFVPISAIGFITFLNLNNATVINSIVPGVPSTIELTANPATIQTDPLADVTCVLTSVVKDRFGTAITGLDLTYELVDNIDENITFDVATATLTVTPSAVDESITVSATYTDNLYVVTELIDIVIIPQP